MWWDCQKEGPLPVLSDREVEWGSTSGEELEVSDVAVQGMVEVVGKEMLVWHAAVAKVLSVVAVVVLMERVVEVAWLVDRARGTA